MEGEKKAKKAPWTAWRALKWLGGTLLAAVNAWAATITIAEKHGEVLTGFAAWTAENAWWLFPVGMLAMGAFAGWQLRRLIAARELGEKDARIRELEKSATQDAELIADLEGEVSYLNDRIYELEHPFMGMDERLRRSGVGGFGDVWK